MAIKNVKEGDCGERESIHQPVMVSEVVEFLAAERGGIFLDGTLGLGGHAKAILNASSPNGVVIGMDVDVEALEIARKNLQEFNERFILVHGNFKEADKIIKKLNINIVDGILLDLGLSSFQLAERERGFSFMREGPLDMRMDINNSLTAEEIINNYELDEIQRIIQEYGEERYARRITKKIGEIRRRKRIRTTLELADIISSAVPGGKAFHRIHPATKTFQALRIAVNHEVDNLKQFFSSALNILKKGGRIVIISFHSLEDRLVKFTFRRWKQEGGFKILTPRIITPEDQEITLNPRARSAKLRAGEKSP